MASKVRDRVRNVSNIMAIEASVRGGRRELLERKREGVASACPKRSRGLA
jgi:hypothetical protein